MITCSQFLFLLLLAFCFTSLALGATCQLPDDEVQALKDIAKTLGKTDWNFSTDPCSRQPPWVTPAAYDGEENYVSCDCTVANDNFSHIVTIMLRQQNLQGRLPPELIRLPYLQEVDLTGNYLNGTIPPEWGSLSNLVHIYLFGNRLSGPIPAELGNITSLKSLDLAHNYFSGKLPRDLGNLPRIEKLSLNSNNFTGELPESFSRFTTLKEFRVSDNQFSGKIPDFIRRWTNLETLAIQGSGLSGPIPSGISFLTNLTDLYISDLEGPEDSSFPAVHNMKNLTTLILRNCNINGTLPEHLGNFTDLVVLDLSYNKLSGGIPSNLERLTSVMIYLTGNFLTGPVPNWTKEARFIDLSYNNFSIENSVGATCSDKNRNLFASFSKGNESRLFFCGENNGTCSKTVKSFHINCGGGSVNIGDVTYESDQGTDPSGPSGANWAYSRMTYYEGFSLMPDKSSLPMIPNADVDLYKNARASSISLTYYGFCLANGTYTVELRFAEIAFTDDDNTSRSVGRRVFDVYIQGQRVLKDFNIANEAQGVGKALVKPFPAYVSNNDLEIRFYWASKGTVVTPQGLVLVYGPLISAISVTSDFPAPSSSRISAGAVVGIVAAAVIIVILVVYLLWWKGCLGKKNSLATELKNLGLQTGLFTLRHIKAATNNFDNSNQIGEGGFGPVYKGILSDGTAIAVKQLSSKSKQGNREFVNEIGLISALQHPCLVKLYGCCVEGDQLLLVYEYMENNSLARALFGPQECRLKLDWPTRYRICVGIARGLVFLHEESRLKVVHRDIKATNVLLDKDLNPKISDFGLAKLDEEDNTHISTRIAGTYGYMAPEYAMHGYLTDKADVYSFGIVALEVVSGKSNTLHRSKEEALYLLDWAHVLKEKGNLLELVDRSLGSDFNEEEAMVMIKVALLCTTVTLNLRPSMSSVLSMLEGITVVPEFVSDPSQVMDEKKLEAMRQHYHQIEEETKISEAQSQRLLIDGPWAASSSAAVDLYPGQLDSSYWEKRD